MSASSTSQRLPEHLFADDASNERAGPGANRVLVWERLLEDGTRADLTDWLSSLPTEQSTPEIAAWLQSHGDRLSARSWSFWSWLIAGLPGVDADLPVRGDNPYWPDAARSVGHESGSGNG